MSEELITCPDYFGEQYNSKDNEFVFITHKRGLAPDLIRGLEKYKKDVKTKILKLKFGYY